MHLLSTIGLLFPGKEKEDLLEGGFAERVVLDEGEVGLGRHHGLEEVVPRGAGVADVEVDIVLGFSIILINHFGYKTQNPIRIFVGLDGYQAQWPRKFVLYVVGNAHHISSQSK